MSLTFMRLNPRIAVKNYVFVDPDNGHRYAALSLPSLIQQITAYREQNGFEKIEHINQVLENYWCSLPENLGSCTKVKLDRSLRQVLKGGVSLFVNIVFKKKASQEEADRRSAICKDCILNVFPDKKGFLRFSDELTQDAVGDSRSVHHDELGNCGGCSCPLRPKVFWAGDIKLTKEEEQHMRDANPACWQLPEHYKVSK